MLYVITIYLDYRFKFIHIYFWHFNDFTKLKPPKVYYEIVTTPIKWTHVHPNSTKPHEFIGQKSVKSTNAIKTVIKMLWIFVNIITKIKMYFLYLKLD